MAAAEPIRNKKNIAEMANYCLKRGKPRNYLLILLGVYTALRISDLLALRLSDVYDFDAGAFKEHLTVTERKTKKTRVIALNKRAVAALRLCFPKPDKEQPERFLFKSNRKNGSAISRIQAYRIIRAAAEAIKLKGHISCHSLRKVIGYYAWQAGVSPVVIMDIYGHSSYEITRRYLGVTQDDRDKVYLSMRF